MGNLLGTGLSDLSILIVTSLGATTGDVANAAVSGVEGPASAPAPLPGETSVAGDERSDAMDILSRLERVLEPDAVRAVVAAAAVSKAA